VAVVFNWNNFEKFGILRKDNFQGLMVHYLCKKSSFDFFVMMFSVAVCESRAIRQKTPSERPRRSASIGSSGVRCGSML
jgi:hypothetical protein